MESNKIESIIKKEIGETVIFHIKQVDVAQLPYKSYYNVVSGSVLPIL